MKTSEIRLMSSEEIKGKLVDTRNDYMDLRFQIVSGQLQDTSKLKQTRRLIAQYETILREKQLAEKVEGEA
ncbi:MAG: 50S ribosomal protein L29 [Chloroflexi bacterium]|nr:50S ribosomal protein L29 [Chloroflexota bacterium]